MIRVVSYNIHKGFAAGNRSLIADALRIALHKLQADIVFLQEVVGQNDAHQSRFAEWPAEPQHDFFRSESLCHNAYGKNAKYPEGHHGNAILSSLPILRENNVDVSVFKFEPRGTLHTTLQTKTSEVHALCAHLGLIEYERRMQASMIGEYVNANLRPEAPLLLVGDFNDWRQRLTPIFARSMGLSEAFVELHGSHARSFPSWLPVSRLDRIYYRNLRLVKAERLIGKPWSRLSDHVPLVAEFEQL